MPIAKWGAACAPCASSKSKCVRTSENPEGRCDRCQSLQKECLKQVHRPRKKRVAKRKVLSTSSRGVSPLESASARSNGSPEVVADPSLGPPLVYRTAGPGASLPTPSSITDHPSESARKEFMSGAPTTCWCHPSRQIPTMLPPESDETLLATYQQKLTRWFPFVVIPCGTRPAELAETRPFLWKVIKMVASTRSLPAISYQAFDVMEHLAEAMLRRAEKSLDLLAGLLVFAGYYHWLCLLHANFHTLLSLAGGLLGDLGLHRTPVFQEAARTNEERRLALGIWYLKSQAAVALNRVDPMRYTAHMQKYVADLEAANEYETDLLLVELIRIQYLDDRIFQLYSRDQAPEELPGLPVVPASVYIDAFKAEFDRLQMSIPAKFQSDHFLKSQYSATRLRLYEGAMPDRTAKSGELTSAQLQELAALGHALNDGFESMLTIPVCHYFHFPISMTTTFLYNTVMLCRWVRLVRGNGSERHEALLRHGAPDIDAPALLDRQAARMVAAGQEMEAAHGLWENNKWDLGAQKSRLVRARLSKIGDIVAVVGGEALLTRKYGLLAAGGANIDKTSKPAPTSVPVSTQTLVTPETTPGAYLSGGVVDQPMMVPGEFVWTPDLLYTAGGDADFFGDVLTDWNMAWHGTDMGPGMNFVSLME